MKFFDMIGNLLMTPVDGITNWFNDLGLGMQATWDSFCKNASMGITNFVVNGVAVIIVSYLVYCACRVMCSNKDETFSEYINKSLIASLGYFFAKYAGSAILAYIGG